MNLKVKRILIIFLSFAATVLIALAAAFAFPAEKAPAYADANAEMTLESITANGASKFANARYKEFYGVKSNEIASYSTNGGERVNGNTTYALAGAFDGNDRTFWISEEGNSDTFKNYVIVNFSKTLPIQSILYKSSYYTPNTRHFSGYPTTLNVYVANGDDNFTLAGTCVSAPERNFSEEVVFSLSHKFECDKIKLEFAEVSVYAGAFNGIKVAATMDMSFFKSDEGITDTVKGSDNLENLGYLTSNSVAAEEMKIRANGGGQISNAFDKNATTFYQSESYNTDIFKNKITLTMDRQYTLSSIVYGCSYYTRANGRNFSGFPTMLKVTATNEDGAQTPYTFGGNPENNWTYANFAFPEPVRCIKLELEFLEVTVFSEIAEGMPIVACSEIFLVKTTDENTEEMLAEINSVFTDYAQYELKDGCTAEYLDALRAEAKKNSGYEKNLKPILDRAEAILTGAMKKDVYREFSTDPDAKNVIERYGDLVSYCRNTLQLTSYGTNRQVIGIGGTTGETITIYVDAPEGDPLPRVAFTQIYGAWNSWMREFTLQRGKNEIVFPNFKANGNYSRAIAAGGPIHIVNPYTTDQQSSNVKMYIEGGYLYPVFHDGDDEGTFRIILTDFYERLSDPNDSSITVDAFEAVAGNVILSCPATLAYNSYVKGGSSPQYNIDKWRKYTIDTLAFGGVEFNKGKPYYNEKNHYIKCNYRAVQPYAGMYAFAANEHIGIIDSATFGAMVQKWTIGWAFYHEMGHMLDHRRMKQPEVTNNMWAIFNIYMVDGRFNDRINVTNVSRNLASDFSAKVGNYHGNGNSNCDFWWIIEGAFPGYWAKLQQMYSFEYTTTGVNVTDATEKLCLFSSIATGEDLTGYFERWGFYFTSGKFNSGNRFTYEKTSQQFKDAMAAAKTEGRITGSGKKIWYVNNDQYRYENAHGNSISSSWASCYTTSKVIKPQSIMGSTGSYTLLLPNIQNPEAHLCYEIQSYIDGAWKVLGITYNTSFTDTYAYGAGVTPQYRVYAYDRMFNRTGDPAITQPENQAQTDVCRIGDVKYNSLKEAVAAATAGDTIYLLKDIKDGGIALNKRLTIMPDPAIFTGETPVTITKNASGHLFNITANVTFGSATGNNTVPTSAPIIFDGNSFTQSGALVYVNACTLVLNNVTMQNNVSTARGGGLYVEYNAAVYLVGCTIKNNSASDGGGIFLNGRSNISARGLTLADNVASSNGGGICELEYTGTSNFHNNDKVNGQFSQLIIRGNSAVNGGGIYTQNNMSLNGAQITGNTATNGGGVYTDIDNTSRAIQLIGCTVSDNTATVGDAIYMFRGKTSLNGATIRGVIYKVYDKNPPAVFELRAALPDLSECEIQLSKAIPEDGLLLCESVTGGLPANVVTEPISKYRVLNGHAQFESGVGVKVYPNEATVTINYGSGTFETTMHFGSFKLPETFEELPEGKYIEKYTIGGREYNVGDTVAVNGDFTAQAIVKDYYKVTLSYGTYDEILLMRQNVVYYLPMKTPDGEVVFGWNCSDGRYYAYAEGVKITGDTRLDAVIKRLHSVITVINGVETEAKYEYGGSVTLPSPPAIFGKAFSHWDIDGKKYAANQTLKVTVDIVATAVYTDSWTVTTVIEDDEQTKHYPNGYELVLQNLAPSLGREFKYWSVNGVKYYAGSTYTVNCDCEIIAVFAQVNTATEITVTMTVNKGPLYNEDGTVSDTIVESEDSTLTYAFNATHTFTAPDVNPGNEFLYWEVNGIKYKAGSTIVVKEAFTAIAVVSQISSEEQPKTSVTVTIKNYVNGEYVASTFEYAINTPMTLEKPVGYPTDKEFSHWLINGVRYEAGAIITVDNDAEAVAVFNDVVLPPPTVDDGNDGEGEKDGSNVGLIVGIVVAVVVVLGGSAAVSVIMIKKKKANEDND